MDLKVCSLEESQDRIVDHEIVYFSNGNYKINSAKRAVLYLKGATVIYGLQKDCPS